MVQIIVHQQIKNIQQPFCATPIQHIYIIPPIVNRPSKNFTIIHDWNILSTITLYQFEYVLQQLIHNSIIIFTNTFSFIGHSSSTSLFISSCNNWNDLCLLYDLHRYNIFDETLSYNNISIDEIHIIPIDQKLYSFGKMIRNSKIWKSHLNPKSFKIPSKTCELYNLQILLNNYIILKCPKKIWIEDICTFCNIQLPSITNLNELINSEMKHIYPFTMSWTCIDDTISCKTITLKDVISWIIDRNLIEQFAVFQDMNNKLVIRYIGWNIQYFLKDSNILKSISCAMHVPKNDIYGIDCIITENIFTIDEQTPIHHPNIGMMLLNYYNDLIAYKYLKEQEDNENDDQLLIEYEEKMNNIRKQCIRKDKLKKVVFFQQSIENKEDEIMINIPFPSTFISNELKLKINSIELLNVDWPFPWKDDIEWMILGIEKNTIEDAMNEYIKYCGKEIKYDEQNKNINIIIFSTTRSLYSKNMYYMDEDKQQIQIIYNKNMNINLSNETIFIFQRGKNIYEPMILMNKETNQKYITIENQRIVYEITKIIKHYLEDIFIERNLFHIHILNIPSSLDHIIKEIDEDKSISTMLLIVENENKNNIVGILISVSVCPPKTFNEPIYIAIPCIPHYQDDNHQYNYTIICETRIPKYSLSDMYYSYQWINYHHPSFACNPISFKMDTDINKTNEMILQNNYVVILNDWYEISTDISNHIFII